MPKLSSILRTIFALLLLQAAFWTGAAPAYVAQLCDFGENIPRTRPRPEAGGPTEVSLSLFIFDLVSVDDVREEFIIDFYIEARWQDPRLGALVRKTGLNKCEISLDDIWRPSAFPLNARDYKSSASIIS